MDFISDLLGTWPGRLLAGGIPVVLRLGWWVSRRSGGKPCPFFGTLISRAFGAIAAFSVMPETIITLWIENRVKDAKITRLEALVRRLGMDPSDQSPPNSSFPGGSESSYVWPGALPSRSKRIVNRRSKSTPATSESTPESPT